jgi:hypothetical protein
LQTSTTILNTTKKTAAVVMLSLSLAVEIFLLLLYLLLKNPQREGISTFHRPT